MIEPTCTHCKRLCVPIEVSDLCTVNGVLRDNTFVISNCCETPVQYDGRIMDRIEYKSFMEYDNA